MSDAEQPEALPSSSARSATMHRITAVFTPDRITAAFTVVLALATLALVVTAYFQHIDAVDAIQASKRVAIATENAATDRRQTASAELILKIDAMLAEHRYDSRTTATITFRTTRTRTMQTLGCGQSRPAFRCPASLSSRILRKLAV